MTYDVAVVGLGPAGRALAHRLLARGATVVCLDPDPDAPWRCTYGGWLDQLPGWLDSSVVAARAPRTDLRAVGRHRLAGTYAMLDNAALRAALDLSGAEVRAGVVDGDLPARAAGLGARRVVDCRGSRPLRDGRPGRPGPAQTAAGVALPHTAAEPLLEGADAVLMDWRPHDGRARWGAEPASFSYAVPLPGRDGWVLVEETCLAGDPPLALPELRRRQAARLAAAGVDPAAVEPDVERVFIPLLPAPRAGDRFGAAGAQLNPVSGYSVFASLAAADPAADALLAGRPLPAGSPWRLAALQALLRLDGDATAQLFDAFGRLGARDQRAVLDPATPTPVLLRALARQWARMPGRFGAELVAATLRGAPSLLGDRR